MLLPSNPTSNIQPSKFWPPPWLESLLPIRVNSRASWFKTLFIDLRNSPFWPPKAVFLRYSPILSNAYPHALWREWPGMRDFLIHSYDSVDPERIDIPCKKTAKNAWVASTSLIFLQPNRLLFRAHRQPKWTLKHDRHPHFHSPQSCRSGAVRRRIGFWTFQFLFASPFLSFLFLRPSRYSLPPRHAAAAASHFFTTLGF